jgi:polysaccharide biosynthesis protein PslH
MKILFYSIDFCYPMLGGANVRTFHFLKELGQKHEVYLISLSERGVSPDDISRLKPYCREINIILNPVARGTNFLKSLFTGIPYKIMHYVSKEAESLIKTTVEKHGIELFLTDYVIICTPAVRSLKIRKCLLDMNLEYILLKRYCEFGDLRNRIYGLTQWKSLRDYQMDTYRMFDMNVFVSEHDRKQVLEADPGIRTDVIEGGIDTEHFASRRQEHPRSPSLIFVGTLWYYPNVQGLTWFFRDVFPLVKKRVPGISLSLVGNRPSASVRSMAALNGAELVGPVPDVRPYMDKAGIFIVPLQIVSGVRYKILEAMSMSIPVVSTSLGSEGLDVSHRENIMIGDSPEEFTRCIQELCADPELWKKISKGGRTLVESRYRADMNSRKLHVILERIL